MPLSHLAGNWWSAMKAFAMVMWRKKMWSRLNSYVATNCIWQTSNHIVGATELYFYAHSLLIEQEDTHSVIVTEFAKCVASCMHNYKYVEINIQFFIPYSYI